jgi:REP element-mobilizing transposase RayT
MQLPDPVRQQEAAARMSEDACRLDDDQRQLVETTIADHCRIRGWHLYAVNCRSNHVHVVVAADRQANEVREQLKVWCTRRLKASEHERRGNKPRAGSTTGQIIRENWWAERGSGLFVNDEEGLEGVIRYVREGQDPPSEH